MNIGQAKAKLSSLVEASLRGEEVILARAGAPQVRLVPVAEAVAADRDARRRRVYALLAEADRLPDRPDAFDPLQWDEHGLPI